MAASFALDGRVVVVTGGLGRLGSSFGKALAAAGAKVAILDVTDDPARSSALFAGIGPDRLRCYAADVTSKVSLRAALERISGELGTPFGLVNNAAIDAPPDAPASENGPFEDYPDASLDRMLDVNVKGVIYC
ncbi:MAG: SDR family NAD(P)-dependent oxidoreductase, partial [Phenylobacterium sp.]